MLNRPWWVRVTWRCCATGLLAAGALTTPASALDIPVFDSASLRMAITSASPGDTVTFLGDITLDADLPAVQTSITIDGAGHTLSGKFMGTVLFRGFFIGAWEEGTATQVPVTVTMPPGFTMVSSFDFIVALPSLAMV